MNAILACLLFLASLAQVGIPFPGPGGPAGAPPPAGFAWTGKKCFALANGTSTVSCPWKDSMGSPVNLAVGEGAVCDASSFTAAVTYTVDDDGSGGANIYTQDGSTFPEPGTGAYLSEFIMPGGVTAANTTAHFSLPAAFNGIACDSAINIKATSNTDGYATGSGTSTATWTTSTITTTANGDGIHCSAILTGGGTVGLTGGGGFTAGAGDASTPFNQYLVQMTAGAITPQWDSVGSGDRSGMICIAIKGM